MDAAQYRAAIGLLGWTPVQLAQRCGLDAETVLAIGAGRSGPDTPENQIVRRTLESGGIAFEDGGARLRPASRDEGLRPEALNTENDR